MQMQIKITPQAIIPEIDMVQPKNVKLRVYDAKTWKEYAELNQALTIPIRRTVTVEGVDGSQAWVSNIFCINNQPVHINWCSMPLYR